MANLEKLNALLQDIDDLLGPASEHTHRELSPTSLADEISKATGLPTAVVFGNPLDTAEQGAHQAAMAAIQGQALPPAIGQIANEATQGIDDGLAND